MAGYSINRIPEIDRSFYSSISSLWQSSVVLNHSPDISKFDEEGSIFTTVSNGDNIRFNQDIVSGLPIKSTICINSTDIGDTITAFVWVKSSSPMTLSYSVNLFYPTSIGLTTPVFSSTETVYVTSGEWTLVRLESPPVVEDDNEQYIIGLEILVTSVSETSTSDIFISHPVIYGTLDFMNNPALLDIYKKLPEFIRQQDADSVPYAFPLARFMEMLTIHTGEMYQIIYDIIYSDISEGKDVLIPETLSTLVEPSLASRAYIYWLSQFTGTQLVNPTTGVTPWTNLPPTWEGIDNLDGSLNVEDSSPWSVIQDSDPEPENLDEFLKWQVQTRYYGMGAGTKTAIIESVKRVLIGTKGLTYSVPSAWNILIKTIKDETPDAALLVVGDSVPSIIDLIKPTKPLGVIVQHELVSSIP